MIRRNPTRQLLPEVTLLILCAAFDPAQVQAQEPPRVATPATSLTPSVTPGHAQAVDATDATPERNQYAITLNLIDPLIGRFGLSVELQPVPHHGLIVTPHYDYLNGRPWDYCSACSASLEGAGVELGYRFYSGTRGFHGFYAGPWLFAAQHRLVTLYENHDNPEAPTREAEPPFTTLGAAVDVGGRWQLGHWVIGGGVGIQYTRILDGEFYMAWRDAGVYMDLIANSGLRPRAAVSVGCAF